MESSNLLSSRGIFRKKNLFQIRLATKLQKHLAILTYKAVRKKMSMRPYNHYVKALLERTLKVELKHKSSRSKRETLKRQLELSEQIVLICLQFMRTCQQPGANSILSLIQEKGPKRTNYRFSARCFHSLVQIT